MRSFFVLSIFIAVAAARPDVSSLGYRYSQPGGGLVGGGGGLIGGGNGFGGLGGLGGVGGHGGGLGGLGADGFGSGSGLSGSFAGGPGGLGGGGLGGGGLGGGGLGGGGFGGGGFGDSGFGGFGQAPLVNKHFYLHAAPEDNDSAGQTKHFTLGRAQKNYRVVFIKAPSSSSANTHLSAEFAPSEEKTVIYVLSQKEHEIDINDIATPAPTKPSKPEVFFIKYKTPEEAAHAQSAIQSQYDRLGGASQVSDEGVAPSSSVVGALDHSGGPGIGGSYLPPSH